MNISNTTKNLLNFIREHNNLCYALPSGEIRARAVYSLPNHPPTKNGQIRVAREWETIPASSKSVRDWLGY